MKTDKLAVYGTLRNGKRDTWKVDGYNLVYPGHSAYPAIIMNSDAKGVVVEIMDVDDYDLVGFDKYEGIGDGLYERRRIKAYNDETDIEAWIYTIGPAQMQYSQAFSLVPNQDWMSRK